MPDPRSAAVERLAKVVEQRMSGPLTAPLHGLSEMGTQCVVCEYRAADVRCADGRLMCDQCARRRRERVLVRLPGRTS